MLTRSELDILGAWLADAAYLPHGELTDIAWLLLAELERHRMQATLQCPWCLAPYVETTSPRGHDVTTHRSHDVPRS